MVQSFWIINWAGRLIIYSENGFDLIQLLQIMNFKGKDNGDSNTVDENQTIITKM